MSVLAAPTGLAEVPATPADTAPVAATAGEFSPPITEAPPIVSEDEASWVPDGFDNAGPADVPVAATIDTPVADAGDDQSIEAVETRESGDLAALDVSAAAACSWYVSPSGSSGNTGRSSSSPLPLRTAAGRTQPGETVCLLAGVYYLSSPLYITRSGTAGRYVTYRSEGGTADLRWTGGTGQELVQVSQGVSYIEIRGLRLRGADRANEGILCLDAHHVKALYNTVTSTGVGGVTAKRCDYTTVHGNTFHHVGYGNGWGSAVSINSSVWLDRYSGFHSYVTNNVISGTYDNDTRHTDGNAIIMDRGADTPYLLVAGNVSFGNYRKCIHGYRSSNIWIVNNTCYKNTLSSHDSDAEIRLYDHRYGHVINNVAYASPDGAPYQQRYATGTYERNVGYAGRPDLTADAARIRIVNPLFSDAFSVTHWSTAPTPASAGTRLAPQSGSPLVSAAIDPRYASGMTSNLRVGMSEFLRTDLRGQARPQGGWDIGAYER